MNEPIVEFVLNNYYLVNGERVTGNQLVQCVDGMVQWNGKKYNDLLFEPINADSDSFTLENVTIGVSFHWKRKEDQTFRGALHLIVENDRITTINILSVEEYLLSVISSEMPEIMGVSNRIYTMAAGRITAELSGDEITEENLMRNIMVGA